MKNKIMNKKAIRVCARAEYGLISSKRSQLTVFIIIAVILVVAVAIIFTVIKKPTDYVSPKENPKGYIQKCARDAASSAENLIIPHGGVANVSAANSVKFNDLDVMFMCYTSGNMQLCNNKHPLLNLEIQKEIKNIIEPKINKCFDDVRASFANSNYKEEALAFNPIIMPNQLYLNITKKITYGQNEQTVTLNNFDTKITSPLYDFISLTTKIVNEETDCDCETQTCNADLTNLNRYNRNYEITKPAYGGNGQEIYSIKEILSGKIFNLAVRNCVRLP